MNQEVSTRTQILGHYNALSSVKFRIQQIITSVQLKDMTELDFRINYYGLEIVLFKEHLKNASILEFGSVQSLSHVQLFETSGNTACQPSLSIIISWSLLKLIAIQSVMPSERLILCPPILLLPSIFPTIRVFSNESVLPIRWSKYWNFSFSISPSNEYSWLSSFRIDWFDLLAVQGTLKSLLQHYSSKHQFFSAQLSLGLPW